MLLPYASKTPFYSFPIVTLVIVGLNVVVHLYKINLLFRGDVERFLTVYAFDPENIKLHTLWTSAFIHGDIFHLLGNVWMFVLVAINLEDKMGRLKFSIFYFLSAPFSAIVYSVVSSHPVVGMSGCVFACIGAFLILHPWGEFKVFYMFLYKIGTFTMPAILLFGFYIAMQIFYGFHETFASRSTGHVAYWGHIGGIIFGVLWVWTFYGFKQFLADEDDAGKIDTRFSPNAIKQEEVVEQTFDPLKPATSLDEANKIIDYAMMMKNYELLCKTFEDAIYRFPKFLPEPGPLFEIAKAMKIFHRDDLAVKAFDMLINFHPDAPIVTPALFEAGQAASNIPEEKEKAINYLEEFIKRDISLRDSLEAKRILNKISEDVMASVPEPLSDILPPEIEPEPPSLEISQSPPKDEIPKLTYKKPVSLDNVSLKGFGSLKRIDEIDEIDLKAELKEDVKKDILEFSNIEPPPEDNNPLYQEEAPSTYNLILKKDANIKLKVIKKILSGFLRTDEDTVEKRIKKGKGLILTDIAGDIARKIKWQLSSYGQESGIFEHTSKTIFDAPVEIDSIFITNNLLRLTFDEAVFDVKWEDVIFLTICAIIQDNQRNLPKKVFDIYSINPNIHFRVWNHTIKSAKAATSSVDIDLNFIPFVEQISKRSSSSKKSILLESFLEGKAMMPKTFNSTEEFDNFAKWELITAYGIEV